MFENYWPMVGGAEHVLQAICEGMAARGHEITVITHQPQHAPLAETKNGVAIVRVPCSGNRYIFTFAAIPKIIKHAQQVDLIHRNQWPRNGADPTLFRRLPTAKRLRRSRNDP